MKTKTTSSLIVSVIALLFLGSFLSGSGQAQTIYTQAATSLLAGGTNLVEKSASTNDVAGFRTAVATAWTNGSGGVLDLPTAVTSGTTVFRGTYGTNNAKRLQLTSSVPMQNSAANGNTIFPISNPNVTTTTANQSDFNMAVGVFDVATGFPLPGEVVTQVGFVIVSRTSVNYPIDLTATAGLSDGSTQTLTATVNGGRGLDDTFYGFTAPGGLSITNIRLQSFVPTTLTPVLDRIVWDDFAFVTGASAVTPQPQVQNLTPAPYSISAASNGIHFQALTYVAIPTTNVSVILNSTDVSDQLIFTGSSTNYSVAYNNLLPDQVYTMTINVANPAGTNSVTETFYTATAPFTLYDSQSFTDDTLYPLGPLQALTNAGAVWTPDLSEPSQVVDAGAPQGKVLERQNTGLTRADVLTFSPVSSGRIIIEFDAFVTTTLGRTIDIALTPTNQTGTLMSTLLSWGQNSGQLAYFDNVNWISFTALPSDWHHCKIINYLSGPAAGTYDVYLNDSLVGQKIPWRNAPVGSPLGRFRLESANTGPIIEYGLVDNLILTAAPEDPNAALAPQILNVSLANHAVVKTTDGLSFNVASSQALAGSNVVVTLDTTNVSGGLVITGPSTNLLVTYSPIPAGIHDVVITAANSSGTNIVTRSLIATDTSLNLFDSGSFDDNTLYPLGSLIPDTNNGSFWAPDTNSPGQIVDFGPPQNKVLQRIQAGIDAIDYLHFPPVSSGILTIDLDARTSVIDSRTLDVCLMQDSGSPMASFIGWGTLPNLFAYFNVTSNAWINLASPGTNWHHYTTINYMSGPNSRTFDVLVDGVVVGLKLPFRQTISVGTAVGRLRVGAIRGTAPGEYGAVDNLTLSVKALTALPNPVSIVNLTNSGSLFQFSFASQAGYTHSVQSKNSLAPGTPWTVLQTIAGDGLVKTISRTNSLSTVQFYRIQTTQ